MSPLVTWFIGFFRYDDAKTWHKTNLFKNKEELTTYLNSMTYINKTSINIQEIKLPE